MRPNATRGNENNATCLDGNYESLRSCLSIRATKMFATTSGRWKLSEIVNLKTGSDESIVRRVSVAKRLRARQNVIYQIYVHRRNNVTRRKCGIIFLFQARSLSVDATTMRYDRCDRDRERISVYDGRKGISVIATLVDSRRSSATRSVDRSNVMRRAQNASNNRLLPVMPPRGIDGVVDKQMNR